MRFDSMYLVSFVVLEVCITACPSWTGAGEFTLDTSTGGGQVGGYYGPYMPGDDVPAAYPPILAPDIDPTFQNYFMGRTTLGPLATSPTTPERRVFFLFDTAGLAASIPSGEIITGVTISLELLPGGTSALANFAVDDKEVVDFSATSFTPGEILDPMGAGISFGDIWSSFGSETPYGSFEILGPGSTTPTMADTYEILLPGMIPDLAGVIAGGGIIAVTAKLATFDPGPIGAGAPPAVDPYEYVFGLTDVVSGGGSLTAAPILTITTTAVPEPGALTLTSLGLFMFLTSRRRRR